jgi:short-subunit dehydrogenase
MSNLKKYVASRALVTGGTSGIGAAIARQLASQGTSLVLVGRNYQALKERVAELEPLVKVEGILADLGLSRDLTRLEERLADTHEPVDFLVNCAGYSVTGPTVEQPLDALLSLLDVNVVALVRLSLAAAKRMMGEGHGRILNISSIAAYRSTPGSVMYAGSKSFVNAFSRGLALELKPAGVVVTCVCPGSTDTPFFPRAGIDIERIRSRGVAVQEADEVASVALAAVAAGDTVTLTSTSNSSNVLQGVLTEWQATTVRNPADPKIEHPMPLRERTSV